MQVVNGTVCMNCSDVAKAKRNIDPAGDGALPASGAPAGKRADIATGVDQPLSEGGRGTRVNIVL